MSFGLRFRLYSNFPARVALIFGICQSVLAILDIALAVAGFVQKIWGHYYATGIWCGLIIFIDGLCGILASQAKTGLGVKTFFAASTVSSVVTFIMIILSFGGLDFRSNFYDQAYLYSGQRAQATTAIHGSLLALGLVEFVVSIINAVMCLKFTCYEKSEMSYGHSKSKAMRSHESDGHHGFMGGNSETVPTSDQPMIRRYHSPRHPNGTDYHRAERGGYTEPTETSEFLPRNPESYNHQTENHLEVREERKQRRSRGSDDLHNKSSHDRVHGRQSNRRRSDGNEGKRRRHPDAESSLDRSTLPKRHNIRQARYHQANDKSERAPGRQEREVTRNENGREKELSSYQQPSGMLSYDSWDRRNKERQSDQRRKEESAQHAFMPVPMRSGNHEPEISNSFRGKQMDNVDPMGEQIKLQGRDSLENRGLWRRNSDKRQSSERTDGYGGSQREDKPNRTIEQSVSEPRNTRKASEFSEFDRTPANHFRVEGFSSESIATPLQRSIGSRGSYSAAVNLMPTESLENLPGSSSGQVDNDLIPPTAFGEEDLPGYSETQANDSHIYSSVSSVSARVTDRLTRLEQRAASADISVADEEIQEILGTNGNRINTSDMSLSDSRPDQNSFPGQINSRQQGRRVLGRKEDKAVVSKSQVPNKQHNIHRTPEASSHKNSDSRTTSHDRLTDEASFALPSPLRSSPRLGSSPTFSRGQYARASDRLPQHEPDDIPEIGLQKSFRASFPLRKSERDRNPRRWGISVLEPSEKSTSPETLPPPPPVQAMEEENTLSELSSSFPLLTAVGGIDFGISDKDSYLESPDKSIYSFSFDEVKPRVFPMSPYRTPRRTSPLTITSEPKMPSSEDELEGRTRVIETVNVGVASPPHYRRNQPKQSTRHESNRTNVRLNAVQLNPSQPKSSNYRITDRPQKVISAEDRTMDNNPKSENQWKELIPVSREQKPSDLAMPEIQIERQNNKPTAAPSRYFYPPERLPSRVDDTCNDNSVDLKTQHDLPSVHKGTQNYEQLSAMTSGRETNSTNPLGAVAQQRVPIAPNLGSSRPEDSNVAFRALSETLSDRTAWERQTYPPLSVDLSPSINPQPRGKEQGHAALRKVMRNEQAAQEEPLAHHAHSTDYRSDTRLNTRRYAVPFAPVSSAPSTGGPPPYSEVDPSDSNGPQDRAPHQPHSSGRVSHPSPNRNERPRRQPVFSLVL